MAETGPREPDTKVIHRAQEASRLLLTDDKDFGELAFHRKMLVPGVVLLRVDPSSHSLQWSRLEAAIDTLGEALFGRYTVVEPGRFRSRPLLV